MESTTLRTLRIKRLLRGQASGMDRDGFSPELDGDLLGRGNLPGRPESALLISRLGGRELELLLPASEVDVHRYAQSKDWDAACFSEVP